MYRKSSLLRKEFADRQLRSTETYNNLRRGKYEPYFPSKDIQDRFREIARNLGSFNAFTDSRPINKSNESTNLDF